MANQAFIFHHGAYYVEYRDGQKSALMPKGIAKDYAEIFGGTVHRHPDFPTIWQRIKGIFNPSVSGGEQPPTPPDTGAETAKSPAPERKGAHP